MNKSKILKKDSRAMCILEYLLLFVMIICITCIWLRMTPIFYYLTYIKVLIPLFTFGIILVKSLVNNNKVFMSKECLVFLVFVVLCIIGGAIGSSEASSFISAIEILSYLISFALLVYILDEDELLRLFMRFVNLIALIAVISLFFYFCGSILNITSPTGRVTFEWDRTRTANTYYYLYFEPQISDNFFVGITKNCGIFTEATMYGYLLSNAYMFCRMKRGKKYIAAILLITIMTTLSTTPILAVVIFETINYVTVRISNRQLESLRVLLFPTIMLCSFWGASIVIGDKLSTASYSVRYDHFISCFEVFLDNIFLGLGYGAQDILKSYFMYQQGLSVGIPYLLAMGGIGALVLICFPIFCYIRDSMKTKNWMNISYVVAFVFNFFLTNVVFNSTMQWFIITAIFMKGSYEMRKELACNPGGGITMS